MNDKLSASALILTIISLLYSVWYKEIQKALSTAPPLKYEDSSKEYLTVRNALFLKSIPVLIFSLIFTLIFTPDAYSIISRSVQLIWNHKPSVYNSVEAAFCFVIITALIFTITFTITLSRLIILLSKISKPPKIEDSSKRINPNNNR